MPMLCSNLGKSNVARRRTRAIVHIYAIFGQLLVTGREGFTQEGYCEHVGLGIFLRSIVDKRVLGRWDGKVD